MLLYSGQAKANRVFSTVWALRIWKIHEMKAAGLTKEEREKDARNHDIAVAANGKNGRSVEKKLGVSLASSLRACFVATKV